MQHKSAKKSMEFLNEMKEVIEDEEKAKSLLIFFL